VRRVAAVDCGTDSLRLLVADLPARGPLVAVTRELRVVRLGEGVDRTGELSEGALQRAGAVLAEYGRLVREHGAEAVRVVATSATRDARNRGAFTALVHEHLGVEPEVLPGEQEAALTFAGAVRDLDPADGPFLVVDIGGGSTEVVLGTSAVEAALSVDVGCVRLTERHLRDDPPTAAQVAAARADIDAALHRVRDAVPVERARLTVGLAGTVTTVAAHVLRLPHLPDAGVPEVRLPAAQVLAACADLLALPRAERAALPWMHPGRVDVVGAGALVLRRVLEVLEQPALLVREADLLDGAAWSLGCRP
jgi:exopolyphosphatase / guanosine-5'-triphosphate,3'-diphosphate pyrophosphatase